MNNDANRPGTGVSFFDVGGKTVRAKFGPYDIASGPSLESLLRAIRNARRGLKVPVRISIIVGDRISTGDSVCNFELRLLSNVHIYSVSCDLQSVDPNDWIITGNCKVNLNNSLTPLYFKASYNEVTETGVIVFG